MLESVPRFLASLAARLCGESLAARLFSSTKTQVRSLLNLVRSCGVPLVLHGQREKQPQNPTTTQYQPRLSINSRLTEFRGKRSRMATTFPDLFGNPVTSASKEAVENFSKAVKAYVCTRESCFDYLKRAVELDPNFALAHCFLVS